jgi:tetratricopeptide (TPR) repeat protein
MEEELRARAYSGIRWWGGAALALVLALCAPAQASVQSELAFHRGVVAYGDGRLDEAREAFQQVVAEDPEDTSALHYLGLIAQAQGDFDEAIRVYEQALAIDPEDVDLRFDLGSAQLEAGRNAEARASFERVIAAEPERARAQLFAGIAAYRTGDYEAAVPRFDRAVALDPELKLHARYYTGLSEAMRGDLGTAAGAFDDVVDASPASPLSRSAGSLRKQVTTPQERRWWNLALTAGLEYDSNPLVAGEGLNQKDDGRGVYRVRGSVRPYETENTSFEVGYDAFFSTHFDETRVDLQTHTGWAAGSLKLEPVRFSLRYDYAYTFIDMSRDFRSLHRVTPSALVSEGGMGVAQIFFQYQNLDYLTNVSRGPLNRDGNQYGAGLTQFFFLPAPFRYVRVGGLGDFLNTQGSEFDYDGWEVNGGLAAALPLDVEMTLLYRFISRDFRETSIFPRSPGGPFPSTKRDEDTHRLTAEVARTFGEHWELSLGGSFDFHDADVGIYDYNRHIAGSYVTYRF